MSESISVSEAFDAARRSFQSNRLDQAAEIYQRILKAEPDNVHALHELGRARMAMGDLRSATELVGRAIAIDGHQALFHVSLGEAFHRAGRLDEATDAHRRALAIDPNLAIAHTQLGFISRSRRDLTAAENCFRRAVALAPNEPQAHINLGRTLYDQCKFSDAERAFREASRLAPNNARVYFNLGTALHEQDKLDEAGGWYQRAIALQPEFPEAYNNLGLALQAAGQIDAAATQFNRAIEIQPDNVHAHFNLARVLLLQRDFEKGWREFTWRRRLPGHRSQSLSAPQWDGSPLAGRLYVYAEQGLGDTLQFIRYLSRLEDLVGEPVVAVQPKLLPLLTASGFEKLVSLDAAPPNCEAQCSLLDLPGLLRITSQSVPAETPYLRADPALVDRWRGRLENISGFRVGIVWQGNPNYYTDRYRSIPLASFEPLASIPGVRLVSQQVGPGVEQIDALRSRFEVVQPEGWQAEHTFMDSAAVMMHLDLLITCDTAAGHLGGALGIPVWVALNASPCWRWMLERTDSPWYPNVRLFRQARRGEWSDVFAAMRDAITERMAHNAGSQR